MVSSRLPVKQETTAEGRSVSWTGRLRPYAPEIVVTGLLVAAFVAGSLLSPYFLDSSFLFRQILLYMEIGVMALGATLIIISGNLDLSIAGNLAMVACVTAVLHAQVGVPMEICVVLGLLLGAAAGAFNG